MPHTKVPVSVNKGQRLASVPALRAVSHVPSTWRCILFAFMGGGMLAAATCRRLYMATSMALL